MSATVIIGEAAEVAPPPAAVAEELEDFGYAKCECCGLTEECTAAYVAAVRGRYNGRWICGLCTEAVKEEVCRSAPRLISTEEALQRQASFCLSFKTENPPPADVGDHLIAVVRRLIRRSLDSPSRGASPLRRGIAGAGRSLSRADSCLPGSNGNPLVEVGDGDLLGV